MLSYRHAFHAGNHADVLKHAVLFRIVSSLLAKDKPFSYLDSHAGAGIYPLDGEWARKTGESDAGILRLLDRPDAPGSIKPYLELSARYRREGNRYPGSPEIARVLAREDDRLVLVELHPAEIDNLRQNLSGDRRVHIHHRDGYSGLLALTPPDPRRGLALMDPSFETTDDYARTAETLIAVHRRWPVGILALWYPLVPRRAGELALIKDRFAVSGIPGVLTAELRVRDAPAATDGEEGFGLVGSGMLVVNPPWKLESELREFLPWLAQSLGDEGQGDARIEWLSSPT
jgi:23S rRNA (adenine2030-N6)-methyltransferase